MPTSTARPAYLEVDAHHSSSINNGTPYSPTATDGAGPSTMLANLPSPTSPSWKNIFRLRPGRSKSTLTLNTEFSAASTAVNNSECGQASVDHSVSSTLYTQSPRENGSSMAEVEAGYVVHAGVMSATLTPSSSVSFGTSLSNRYSSNSTGTLSSESGIGIPASLSGQKQNQSQIVHLNSNQSNGGATNGHTLSNFSTGSMRGRRSSRTSCAWWDEGCCCAASCSPNIVLMYNNNLGCQVTACHVVYMYMCINFQSMVRTNNWIMSRSYDFHEVQLCYN